MSCYTLQSGKKLNFLKPLSLNATIGVSTKSSNSNIRHTKSDTTTINAEKEPANPSVKLIRNSDTAIHVESSSSICYDSSKSEVGPLGICIHADMSSINIAVSEVQVLFNFYFYDIYTN